MSEQLLILYEDNEIIVVRKPAKVPTQTNRIGTQDMVSLLKNYLYKKQKEKGEPYLAVIHRLDQPVEGILVFAKTPRAAKCLSAQLQQSGFGKYYQAILVGLLEKEEGSRIDYLVKDGKTNMSRECRAEEAGAKKAELSYRVLRRNIEMERTLVQICLGTGRHHQIRVQMSNMGYPILGDTKYNRDAGKGAGWEQIALCAYRLEFQHPNTKKPMCFEIEPSFNL